MKAIILAAGYATRLYPITEKFSKALLPVNGKPIINYITDSLYKIEGLDKIFVVANDLFFNDFLAWKDENNYDKIVVLNDKTTNDTNKLGAIGDINFTINNGNIDDDTLIIAGDTYFNFELYEFANFFREKKLPCVCVKEEHEQDLTRFGIAEIVDDKIIGIEEKPQHPKSNNIVYACYLFNRENVQLVKEYLDEGNTPDAPGNFVAWLCKREEVRPFKINGFCVDIGTHESYNNAQNLK